MGSRSINRQVFTEMGATTVFLKDTTGRKTRQSDRSDQVFNFFHGQMLVQ